MNKAVIAMGSNIDPEYHIPYALKAIDEKFTICKMSDFIYTKPLLYENQDNFLNGSILIETDMNQPEIVVELKAIEDEMRRDRNKPKNGPRKIDLDLVVFNHDIVDEDVYKRKFLKEEVLELIPDIGIE